MATSTDYDARRVGSDTETSAHYVEQFARRRNDPASGTIDVEEAESTQLSDSGNFESSFDNEWTMPVVPVQADEFTCSRCFLIFPRRRFARTLRSKPVCVECS